MIILNLGRWSLLFLFLLSNHWFRWLLLPLGSQKILLHLILNGYVILIIHSRRLPLWVFYTLSNHYRFRRFLFLAHLNLSYEIKIVLCDLDPIGIQIVVHGGYFCKSGSSYNNTAWFNTRIYHFYLIFYWWTFYNI